MTHSRDRFRVLHVIESFGGGSLSALRQYIASTPDLEHHVIRRVRDGEYSPVPEDEAFASVTEMPANLVMAVFAIQRAARNIEPHIVHAQSSLGGVLARVSLRSSDRRRIVYTPHCFAFERLDVRPPVRWAFRATEWLLALNTYAVAGCSPAEAGTAQAWSTCKRSFYVPNLAHGVATSAGFDGSNSPPTVVAAGRLSAQKDPAYFGRVVAHLQRSPNPPAALWLGDGEPVLAERLERTGISVSGWRPPDEVQRKLSAAAVYVHTARWEGFPMMILEAHESGVPIVARRIKALAGLDPRVLADSEQELANKVLSVLGDPSIAAQNRSAWSRFLENNTRAAQRSNLLRAYGLAEPDSV